MPYKNLAGPERLWIFKRRWQIQFLLSQGLKEEHVLLDLGCGPLRGGIPIIEHLDVGHYHGLDLKRECIVAAKMELEVNGLKWKQPRLNTLQLVTPWMKFDFIWCFSVVMHVEDDELSIFFDFIKNSLLPEGVCFLNVNYGKKTEYTKWKEFCVNFRSFNFYAIHAKGLSVEEFGTLESLNHKSGNELQDRQMLLKLTLMETEDDTGSTDQDS